MIYTSRAWSSILFIVAAIAIGLVSGDAGTTKPAALSMPVLTDWLGDDGIWSPVSIRVGTPPQWVNVFVSTASEETWVVGPGGGCTGSLECEKKRGGIFRSDNSSTWVKASSFALGLDPELGFGGNGDYGFDSIALSEQISVPSQTIAVINTTEYWLGFMGLGITPTNFSAGAIAQNSSNGTPAPNVTNVDQKTFLSSLVETKDLIPSHSYGYTAGAYYRLKHVPSSLTLGGYDANRFTSHNVSFGLDPNLDPVVALNGITVTAKPFSTSTKSTGWSANSATLLGPANAALYTIDSSTPYLWLPESVCSQFEKELGLKYDENVRLYTFDENSSQYETLLNWNLTFDFVIADLPGSSNSVSLSLPYAAFDLELTYPFPNVKSTSQGTKYFPLRKAANDTQYTIGRAFLQETYLVVDYERNNFSLYQAIFTADASTNKRLVDITPPTNSSRANGPTVSISHGAGKGAIIGIAVGASIACLVGVLIVYICVRRRRAVRVAEAKKGTPASPNKTFLEKLGGWFTGSPKAPRPTEIEGTARYPHEAPTDGEIMELPTTAPSELPGSEVEISPYEAAERKFRMNVIAPDGHNPTEPVELQTRSSTEGFYAPKDSDSELEPAPSPRSLPPYSPSHVGQRNTQTTGVSSRSMRTSRASSNLSSPMVISPLTPSHRSPGMPSLFNVAGREQWPLRDEDSDYSDLPYPHGSPQSDTPRSAGDDGAPISVHSPLPSPRSLNWERR
ncbi:hypothetical protein MMC07_009569 [Pseudocyphellaria aurata]|nr:hypothetical protein [Pseudocyphellaria aurata]